MLIFPHNLQQRRCPMDAKDEAYLSRLEQELWPDQVYKEEAYWEDEAHSILSQGLGLWTYYMYHPFWWMTRIFTRAFARKLIPMAIGLISFIVLLALILIIVAGAFGMFAGGIST